jgi:parvulin-like peptidyl-prolyl isomerase
MAAYCILATIRRVTAAGALLLGVALSLGFAAPLFSQVAAHAVQERQQVVARVNGIPITESALQDEMEVLYPSNAAHGGLSPEKLQTIRAKALNELVVEELAYQRAVRERALVAWPKVQAEYQRLRHKSGAAAFDRSLQASGLTRQLYLKNLRRRMTLERIYRQEVYLPSRVEPAALRAYYQQHPEKFRRPEQVHARLILVAVSPQAKPDEERQAKEKIEKIYQLLQAGKDFGRLAEQYSDDFYRVKGGDLGWVHRGRLEPEFEKVAFSLAVGQFSAPFRTPYGYNLMKVEGREPAHRMTFEEIQPILKAELEQHNLLEQRRAWVARLKKGASIEIVSNEAPARASAAH